MTQSSILIWPVLLPLIFGTVVFLIRGRSVLLLSLAGAIGTALASFRVSHAVHQSFTLVHEVGGWGAPLGIVLRADGLAAVMLGLSGLVGLVISVYSLTYFKSGSRKQQLFWPIWLLLWGGLNGLFISGDIFNLYVTLELVSLGAIPLIALAGTRDAIKASLRYLLLALLGSMSYLFGVGLLYMRFGVLDLAMLGNAITPDLTAYAAIALMIGGLIIKSALFPMHFWLPPAHSSAPAPVSAALSGLVVTASFYMVARLWFYAFPALDLAKLGQLIGLLGCGAILWGGWQAMRQERLKMLVAYSTVSQIGYLFLVFPLCNTAVEGSGIAWSGSILFAVSHAIAKSGAFLAAGIFINVYGHDRISELRGAGRQLPMVTFAFALAGVNLMGLPPSGGFVGKWMLLKAAFITGQWGYGVVIVCGGLLAFCYIFRVLEQFMTTPDENAPQLKAPVVMTYSVLSLAVVAVSLGFFTPVLLGVLGVDSPVSLVSFAPEALLP
ncbi:proton-conducting transporter membrane subunit [Pontiellaceae bacterium B12227]|nr:proton-conducting transporter membrane subunit [Pontiellaceae bacterium B12227]